MAAHAALSDSLEHRTNDKSLWRCVPRKRCYGRWGHNTKSGGGSDLLRGRVHSRPLPHLITASRLLRAVRCRHILPPVTFHYHPLCGLLSISFTAYLRRVESITPNGWCHLMLFKDSRTALGMYVGSSLAFVLGREMRWKFIYVWNLQRTTICQITASTVSRFWFGFRCLQ